MTDLALVLTTLIWGSTFILVKESLTGITPMRFLALRFLVAAVVLFGLVAVTRTRVDRATWRAGALAGIPFFLSFLTQTFGLVWASPATSAFLTGTSVVLVPLASVVLLRHRVGPWTWAGALAAFAGLALLAFHGGGGIGIGELWTIGTAVAVAAQLLLLERLSPGRSPLALTATQCAGCAVYAVLCLPLDAIVLGHAVPGPFAPLPARVLLAAVYMGCAATALAFFLQTWAQARISATRVGVLFALEPVFALLFSFFAGAERLSARAVLGMALILAGMLLVEALGRREAGSARRESAA
jgi:drug/metabolite transporter (DMT)-like permease